MCKVQDNITGKIISVRDLISAKYALELMQNGTVFGSTGKVLEVKKTAFLLAELSETTQQKIYEKWEFETDLFTDCYADFLTMLGFSNPVLCYSVSFSQSDYAGFSCDSFSYEKGFLAKVKRNYGTSELLDFAKRLAVIYKKTGYTLRGKVVEGRCGCVVEFLQCDNFDAVEADLQLWIKDYSRYLLKELQDKVIYQTSFENFVETCAANEYLFTENGTML